MIIAFDIDQKNITIKQKLSTTIKSFGWLLLIKLFYVIVLAVGEQFGLKTLTIATSQISLGNSYSEFEIVLLIVIVLPVIEEVSFRGWLTTDKNIFLACIFFFSVYCSDIIIDDVIGVPILYYYRLAISFLIGLLIIIRIKVSIEKVNLWVTANLRYLALASISLFSLVHFLNYTFKVDTWTDIIGFTFVISIYPIMAIILTRIRINNGIVWSAGLHCLNNSMILLPMLLSE